MTQLNTEIQPADQRRAAEITEAFVECDGVKVGEGLAELVDLGIEPAIAVVAVLARNLAVTLVQLVGAADALRTLEATKLDAAVVE
ncbi:hypothetical protein KUF57_12415 [Mycolicibacterium sp. PAM1]|uniref:Uncharacterized protein n=1 Tax=Mycolicibacterium gilvum (strain PYR-GCK) TaxID=350054 RepID=A4TBL4_MYCGI|nr:hypothetical protein [Mycolicibacterium sp. PAM1]ABP45396.1 hypothetical protein Mflv_2919 [Mycolicibacterium gilvum PYR-GCK]MBV5244338.1 hypothetical protein [Mycolicibacterium sp. PAM1]